MSETCHVTYVEVYTIILITGYQVKQSFMPRTAAFSFFTQRQFCSSLFVHLNERSYSLVLIYLGYHNKISQTAWFKQQKLIFSQSWRLESLGSGCWQGFTLRPRLLSCRQHPSCCVPVQRQSESKVSCVSSYKDTNPTVSEIHPYDLI